MNNGLIILDFDGTLCDTKNTIVKTLQMTMEKLCLPVADEYACAATIGLPLSESFKTMFPSLTEGAGSGVRRGVQGHIRGEQETARS